MQESVTYKGENFTAARCWNDTLSAPPFLQQKLLLTFHCCISRRSEPMRLLTLQGGWRLCFAHPPERHFRDEFVFSVFCCRCSVLSPWTAAETQQKQKGKIKTCTSRDLPAGAISNDPIAMIRCFLMSKTATSAVLLCIHIGCRGDMELKIHGHFLKIDERHSV